MEKVIRVGTAGWSYDDWKGVVYPQSPGKEFDPLAYLARYLDTVEVNSTFYRPPVPRTTSSWVQRVAFNPRFRFTVKLWRKFTHEREGLSEEDVLVFKSGLDPLAEAGLLGCILLQFPWSFRNLPENRCYLEELMRIFNDYPRVLEVRHASWDHEEVYRFLEEEGVGFCNIDQPLFRDSLGPTQRFTGVAGYVRLHGQNYKNWFRAEAGRDQRYDYLYSMEELKSWVDKIINISLKVNDTFVITNNHFRGQAACNALQLKSILGGDKIKVPIPLLEKYPQLKPITIKENEEGGDQDSQQKLF